MSERKKKGLPVNTFDAPWKAALECYIPLSQSSDMNTIDTLLLPWEERALKKGRQQGRQQGHEQGVLQALCADVLEVLAFRFGDVPGEVTKRLAAIKEAPGLRRAHHLALSAPSLPQFAKGLTR